MVYHSRDAKNSDAFHEAIHELETASDRAAAIVGASLAEMALDGALVAHLHRNKKITDNLFRPSGAFGSLAVKIDLGLLIGLYGEQAHSDLVILKDIRNRFAHRLDINSFEVDEVKDRAMRFELCERYTISPEDAKQSKADNKGKPVAEWEWWFSVIDRAEMLATPRGRFIVTIQVMHYGLSIAFNTAMPEPPF